MGSLLKGGSMDKLSSNSGQFDPTNWQTIARMHLRTRYEDFPEEDIEIVGGYMGDVSMPPPPGAIYLCETDSMDQGIAEVTERFSLAVEGSKPWTFLLYSTSEYDSGRLVARVLSVLSPSNLRRTQALDSLSEMALPTLYMPL